MFNGSCWFCFRCVLTVLPVWANVAMQFQRFFGSSGPKSCAPPTQKEWTATSNTSKTRGSLWSPKVQKTAEPAFKFRDWCLDIGVPVLEE